MRKLLLTFIILLFCSPLFAGVKINPFTGKPDLTGSGGGGGSITTVGDCDGPACFEGSEGTTLTGGIENSTNFIIKAVDAVSTHDAVELNIIGGSGGGISGNGGGININSGSATTSGSGGNLFISGGSAAGMGNGATVSIAGGDADTDGNGGALNLAGGNAADTISGNGASVAIFGGSPGENGNGGSITIGSESGGATSGDAGDINISAPSTANGSNGDIKMTATDPDNVFINNVNICLEDGTNCPADTITTAGRSLTLTGSTIDADAELYTPTALETVDIETPVTGDSGHFQKLIFIASTITEVSCDTDTGTVTINIDKRAKTTPNTSGTAVLSAGLVCDNNNQSSCASGCDVNTITSGAVTAGQKLAVTISATASSPTFLRVHVKGTVDD